MAQPTIEETKLFLKSVGAKIKAIRQEKKISQRELAELCDLNHNTIFRIEAGKRDTDICTIYNLAEKLEVHPKEFFPPINLK
ncbi:MAG: helix-turn-helix transcriptional regulator [Ferruginibacter sp.]